MVGGFLVAASAVGTFAAYEASQRPPSASYVVLAADVDAGDRLGGDDLALVALDLPAGQRRHAFTDARALVGATALGPLAAGQLLQDTDVAKPAGGPDLAQISIPVDPGFALNGDIRRGERVDVIVTYTESGESVTSTVARAALVVSVDRGGGGVGRSGSVVVVLAVPPASLEEVARAAAAGRVALARTTGVESGGGRPAASSSGPSDRPGA